jgi:hypothetical protein
MCDHCYYYGTLSLYSMVSYDLVHLDYLFSIWLLGAVYVASFLSPVTSSISKIETKNDAVISLPIILGMLIIQKVTAALHKFLFFDLPIRSNI